MNKTPIVRWAEIAALALIIAGLFGSLALMELRAEEPRRAIVSMEMILRKEYIVPQIFSCNYYNKPPLFNWLLVLTFKLSGSFAEFWVRLPCILSFLLTAYFVYRLVKQYATTQTAFIAAMLLLVSADILFYGAVDAGELDLFFMMLVFGQAVAIFKYSNAQQWWRMFLLSYLFTAAGILTKGLPSVAIQGLTLVCWLIYIKQCKKLFSVYHLAGIALAAFMVLGYFIMYAQKQDVRIYILRLLSESTEKSAVANDWDKVMLNIIQAPLQILYICCPSTLLLLYAFNKKVRVLLKPNPLFMFSFIFTVIIGVIFFASAQTANRYVYPAFPFIAIMGALTYTAAKHTTIRPKWVTGYKTLLATFAILGVMRIAYNVWGVPYQLKTLPQNYRNLAATILQYTNNTPVFLTGYQQPCPLNTYMLIQPAQDTVYGAPVLPYQIPYYVTKATGTIMQYDAVPQKDRFYLTPVNFLKGKKASIYFTFYDDWNRRNVALVKF